VYFGSLLGELWWIHNDIAAGVNSMVRFSPQQRATVDDGGYLYVSTEVDAVTTDRRYPQILISDQPPPVQDTMADGLTLIVAPVHYAPSHLELQLCDHHTWDLNDPCPTIATVPPGLAAPGRPPGDTAGADTSLHIELYLSPTRLYLRTDGEPYACVELPAVAIDGNAPLSPPTGEVSISWGSVLAHSAIDFGTGGGPITAADSYAFERARMQTTSRRHLDNLGFASGVAEPAWDHARIPCAAP
jgi:hypothetical protein